MVVLVRCSNGTHTLALESRLDELIEAALIVAILSDDRWIAAADCQTTPKSSARSTGALLTTVASPC